MLALLMTVFLQTSFADTNNPIIKAVAAGCGDKVYTKVIDTPEIDELAACYQTALDELPRKRLPTIELGFQTCAAFKAALQQYVCLDRFKDEAHDPNLYKIFNDCTNSEKDLRKKYLASIQCINNKKAHYPTETSHEIKLSPSDIQYLKVTQAGCGKGQGISSNFIEQKEVEGLANCYQTALLGLEKTLPNLYNQTLELCDNFVVFVQKVECMKRIATELKNDGMNKAITTCLDTKRKDDIVKKGHTTVSHTFKKPEVFYSKGYDCIKGKLLTLSETSSQQDAVSAPAVPASGHR
jgi:hypothetical protein